MTRPNKGLGRGINAIFEDLSNIEKVDLQKEQIQHLLLADLRPNPYQPRKTFDEKALRELADSIAKTGVFQPIIVRQSEIKGYDIIAGERRFRASKLAGKETIPAIVKNIDESEMMQIAVLENLQREDLNPMEEAEAYEMLMTNLKLTQVELAEQLGKSRPYIANYLRLLALPEEIKQYVQSGDLSTGQARTLLSIKDTAQMIVLAHRVVTEKITVRQLEQLVAEMNEATEMSTNVKKMPKKVNRPYYIEASEDRLMDKFGTSVRIHDKEGKGKIEIEYLSEKDLTRILDIIEIRLD